MRKSDKLAFESLAKNKNYNFELEKIRKCSCGKFPEFVIVVYYLNQWYKVKFNIFFYCSDCISKRLSDIKFK